jgi:hypothetical protein
MAAALVLGTGNARAAENNNWGSGGLCKGCAGKAFTDDIGQCRLCKRGTSSGAFKLCQACSKKTGKCQACPANTGAAGGVVAKKPADGGAAKNDNWGSGALCAQCKEKAFILNIGKCSGCGRGTSSGAFKLCQACGRKAGKCQACGAAIGEVDAAAKAAVEAWLKANVKGEYRAPQLREVSGGALKAALPGYAFFSMRFMMHPVPRPTPQPLGATNLFVVSKAGSKVTHVKDVKGLQDFFAKSIKNPADEKGLRAAAHAYCLLRKEMAQDGFFRFQVKPENFKVNVGGATDRVTARIEVVPGGGNSGHIEVVLAFRVGAAVQFTEDVKVAAGVRPICQSLRLLNPDVKVRAAAERDLLIMGRNALPYLYGKIAETKGELREKIRELTRRIENGAGGPAVEGGQPEAN